MTLYERNGDDIDIGLVAFYKLNDLSRVAPDGIVGHWKMNDDESDTNVIDSKHGNTGTASDDTDALTGVGKISKALTFADTNVNVDLGNPSELQMGDTDSSIFMWVKITPPNDFAYLYASTNGTLGELSLGVTNSGVLSGFTGNSQSSVGGQTDITDDAYHHVGIVYSKSAGTLTYYVDGAPDGVDSELTGTWNTTVNKTIGSRVGSATLSPTGLIDDVRVYNRALSTSEVEQIFNSDTGTETTLLFRDTVVAIDRANFNDGTFTGTTATTDLKGINGNAVRLNGVDDFIALVDDVLPLQNFTFCAWFQKDDTATSTIFWDGETQLDFLSPDKLRFRADGEVDFFATDGIISVDIWYHVVVTYDGAIEKIYVNGIEEASAALTGDRVNEGAGSYCGKDDGGSFFNGSIKNLRLYSKVLTPGEISKLYRLRK